MIGGVYFNASTSYAFRYVMLRLGLHARLVRQTVDKATHIQRALGGNWELRDDIVNPFGDPRGEGLKICTFDLENGLLLFSNASENRQIRFAYFNRDVPTLADFTPFTVLPSPRIIDISAFSPPHWEPRFPVAERVFIFIERIFSDFNFQWRHFLRCAYADTTFRKLARAVLSIALLDFNVVEISESMDTCANNTEPYASNIYLPSWEPFLESTFNLGRTWWYLTKTWRTR
jgi:hypothetical protein